MVLGAGEVAVNSCNASSSSNILENVVPPRIGCPVIILADTPVIGSSSPNRAARVIISSVCSKEAFARGPIFFLLTP